MSIKFQCGKEAKRWTEKIQPPTANRHYKISVCKAHETVGARSFCVYHPGRGT